MLKEQTCSGDASEAVKTTEVYFTIMCRNTQIGSVKTDKDKRGRVKNEGHRLWMHSKPYKLYNPNFNLHLADTTAWTNLKFNTRGRIS